MSNRKYRSKKQSHNLALKKNADAPKYSATIAPKAVASTRKDIASWKTAEKLTNLLDFPKWYLIQQLFKEIKLDALLTSQLKNRQLKGMAESVVLKKANGEVDEEQTKLINNAKFTNEINQHILDSIFSGHSLIELSLNAEKVLQVDLLPRENVDPKNGRLFPDYTEDTFTPYREVSEYGTWLLEFGSKGDLGLLNNAVPHVLFKRFAQSCWSELCEIYGIPPRVMKTNTQDPAMVKRGETMMRDMGAAAWFIIDESESFEWAKGVNTNGDVYSNLMTFCNNEISLLITGAVIGQDTQNGSRSKDESGQEMLNTLSDSDLRVLEQAWNTTVIPALLKIGVLKGDITYGYEQTEDLAQLWTMTKESLPYFDIKPEWVKEKFGVEVVGKREVPKQNNLNLGADFFD